MYINSFITELSKKVETVDVQLKDFESKMDNINSVKKILTLKTLKDVDSLTGKDLVLLDNDDFAQILEVFNIPNAEEKMQAFFDATTSIKIEQKLVSENEGTYDEEKVKKHIIWLDEQANYIKEYIKDFNENNKEYYNSLKASDNLYKKYIGFFKDDKLIKPIYDIEEFNEVIKKSGIISSEKWQLLKYVGEKNLEFDHRSSKKDEFDYTDQEIISFVENILKEEKELIDSITEEKLKISLEFIDYSDEQIKEMNLTEKDIVDYEKMPIVDTMKKIYDETIKMLKSDEDKDALKIEKNLKKLLELVDSYNVLKKIE